MSVLRRRAAAQTATATFVTSASMEHAPTNATQILRRVVLNRGNAVRKIKPAAAMYAAIKIKIAAKACAAPPDRSAATESARRRAAKTTQNAGRARCAMAPASKRVA